MAIIGDRWGVLRLWLGGCLFLAACSIVYGQQAGMLAMAAGGRSVPATLAEVARHVATLPADELALAAEAGADGHWRLVSRQGETFSAATPEELKRGFATLLPPAARAAEPRITIHVTDESVFRHPGAIATLPPAVWIFMRATDASFRIIREGSGPAPRLLLELRASDVRSAGRGIFVELTDRARFDEVRYQLARRWERPRTRLLALEPGVAQAAAAKGATGTKDAKVARSDPLPIVTVDPDRMRRSFAGISGATALLAGRIEGERLVYQPSTGPERSILIRDYISAARERDVDLILLGANAARQPGTRNWLWLKSDIAGLERSLDAASLGSALAGLAGDGAGIAVALTFDGADRVRLTARPISTQGPRPIGSEWLTDIVSSVTGTASTMRIEADLGSRARREELAARVLPGVPSRVQYVLFAALLLGVLAFPVAWRWWQRIWPAESPGEYAGTFGYRAAQAARSLAFAAVFLPLAGPIAFFVRAVERLGPVLRRKPAMPH